MRKEQTMGTRRIDRISPESADQRRVRITNIIVQNEREREKNQRRSRRKSRAAKIARKNNRKKH
jgi:hypothetical protein